MGAGREKDVKRKEKKPGRGLIICGFVLVLLGVGLFILGGELLVNSNIFGASFLFPGIVVAVIGVVMKDFGFSIRESSLENEKSKDNKNNKKDEFEN